MNGMPEEKRGSEYTDTMEALRRAESVLPDFTTDYDGEIRKLYEQIVSRPAFRYDPGSDPLYQSYRTQMVSEGSRAMRDTTGQAAALTGGYGSSYAESAGQQAYGLYLQKLGQAMPELYKSAYDRYRAEGEGLRADLNTAKSLAESEYGRKRERFQEAAELEKMHYERGEKNYQKLVNLISGSGYEPTDEELSAAGMNRAQAEALRNAYLLKNPLAQGNSDLWAKILGGRG